MSINSQIKRDRPRKNECLQKPVSEVKFNPAVFNKWLNSFSNLRAIRALQELRLYTISQRCEHYPRTEEDRERLRKTIEIVNDQFRFFNQCLSHLVTRDRNILIRWYFGDRTDLNSVVVDQAKKDLYQVVRNQPSVVDWKNTNINTPAIVYTELGESTISDPKMKRKIDSLDKQIKEITPRVHGKMAI